MTIRPLVLALMMGFACPAVGALPERAHAQDAHPQEIRTLDVNTATVEELDGLPGIGPSKAAAIVEARNRRPFRRLNDLLRVPGIGRSTLERLRPYLRFGPPSRA